MGTPEFAVPSLAMLIERGYEVVGVVTATDKYGGRGGKQLIVSPVKAYAASRGIPVLQPEKLRDPVFLAALRALGANLQIVVAFRMLPEVVWAMPELGTFNLHGSLLPKYRGAAPINWAVINGEQETGVTTFFLQHEIDTGDLLQQATLAIGEDETAGELHDRMMVLGAETVLSTVQAIEAGGYKAVPQDDSAACKAPKLFRETCEIDFAQPVAAVYNFIRGLSPHPAAWTLLDGLVCKIMRASKDYTAPTEAPGTFVSDQKKWLKVAALDGYIQVLELQVQGRKHMEVVDFLNGYKV